MSQPNLTSQVEDMRDPIVWQQIFIGYGMVFIMLALAVLHQLGFSGNRDAMTAIGTAGVFGVLLVAAVLAGPIKTFQRHVLASRPVLEDRLQWAAIAALVMLSMATIVHGILVLPASGWSS